MLIWQDTDDTKKDVRNIVICFKRNKHDDETTRVSCYVKIKKDVSSHQQEHVGTSRRGAEPVEQQEAEPIEQQEAGHGV